MIFSPEPPTTDRKPRTFQLSPSFLDDFKGKQPNWGPVGYFTYKRCVDVSTPVLCDDLRWRPAGELQEGQGIVGFDGEAEGMFRHVRLGVVKYNKVEKAQTVGIELENGEILYATPDHRWLVKLSEMDNRMYWKESQDLASTHKGGAIHLVRPFGPVWEDDKTYEGGFLSAAFDGEGCFDRMNSLSFIQVDNGMLRQVEGFLDRRNVRFKRAAKKVVEGRHPTFSLRVNGRDQFLPLLGSLRPPRLLEVFRQNAEKLGGDLGALRCGPENLVKVVRVFDAGERDIAVLSTDLGTHFTGGFASHNTYARKLDDGTTEEFWQTLQRVVEGCYNIQKLHCRQNHKEWIESKAQRSAQEMFRRMWDFKFTPPGRGLWMMGTDLIFEKGSAALQNCFAGDTEVITAFGTRTIKELAETKGDATLLTTGGKWVEAPVRSFGKQKLYKLWLTRQGVDKVIHCTGDHRWFARDRRQVHRGHGFVEFKTTELRPEVHHLQYVFGQGIKGTVNPSAFGVAHGFTYGDGRTSHGERNANTVSLFGEKDAALKPYFGGSPSRDIENGVEFGALPNFFRERPSITENKSYLLGWLMGYFAADGSVSGGQVVMSSAKEDDLKFFRDVCIVLGIGTYEIRPDTRESNLTGREHTQYRMTLMRDTLVEDFFVIPAHRASFAESGGDEVLKRHWTVKHIEETDRVEEVYCATVDGYGAFALEGNILTGNCAFVSTDDLATDFAAPFCFLMDMSMLGVGVGGDTRGAGSVKIQMPKLSTDVFTVEDSREGWVDVTRTLLNSFVGKGAFPVIIDFSQVRKRGEPIKGFGGIASGASPLKKLLEGVTKLLMPKGVEVTAASSGDTGDSVRFMFEGNGKPYKITSSQIVDVFNYIGKCVVAGGVRRTAEIMFGDHDDDEFISLKDNSDLIPLYAKKGDLEVTIKDHEEKGLPTEKLVEELEATEQAIQDHPLIDRRWASNNSVFGHIGMDYTKVAEAVAAGGEPGIFWLDNARAYSRMGDAPDWKDDRVMGTNPCVTGDTILFTSDGPMRADKLLDKPFFAVVDEVPYKSNTGVFKTGVKPVYLVQTKEGHSVKVTADHRILACPKLTRKKRYEAWVEAQDLDVGDQIILNNVRNMTSSIPWGWDGMGTFDQGWLLGNLLGDGHFHAEQETAKLQFWGATKETMLGIALQRIESLGGDPRYHQMREGSEVESRDMVSTGSRRLWELAPEFGISHAKDITNDTILMASSEFQTGFLRGLFDADGSVQGSQEKGVSIRLASSNRQHLKVAQQMLMHFGINSTVYWNRREAGERRLPDGQGGMSPYWCEAQHELVIANDNLVVFSHRIGFDDPEKMARLTGLLDGYKRTLNRERFVATVESVTYIGTEPVYDATVNEVHRFGANGITVHNCGEQSLESFELCNLVETYPAHHDSLEDFRATLKMAYLYAKTVTLVPTHDHRANQVMQYNRRIGASMSGIVQARQKLGHREFLKWCDEGYKYIGELDAEYSRWLGIPNSKKMTSVKPSGTVSLLCGATPGIHFPHSEHYIRRIRVANTSPLVEVAKAAGYPVEADIYADDTTVVSFPVKEKHFTKGKNDATMWEQFALAAALQRHWADNQVSVTVSFNKDEAKDIATALATYEDQLKSISMLPVSEHGFAQAPYEEIDEATFNQMAARITLLDFGSADAHDVDAEEKFCSNDSCTIDFGPKS